MLRNFLIERVMCYTLTSEEKCKFKGGGGYHNKKVSAPISNPYIESILT